MARYKFDDCTSCRFKRQRDVCDECDSGEQFEDASIQPLRFDDEAVIRRASKSPLTDDNEIDLDLDQDELIERLDEEGEREDDE